MTRRLYAALALAGVAATLAPAFVAFAPRLIWNASASAPIGFYIVDVGGEPSVGDLVSVAPPPRVARFIAARGYLPAGVPLLKRVAARAGQRVCRDGDSVRVDGATLGRARASDSQGRPLPDWQGCRVLMDGEIFLMNADAPDSLDGRYFGPLPASAVRGRLIPLFTDPDGDGRFTWRVRDALSSPQEIDP
ncbi:MAG: S26 family signal peptidase [Hyphomonadaceae bacterium]